MCLIKFRNSFVRMAGSFLAPTPDPEPDPNTVIIGGRTYRTVEMPDGNTWLAENLDYKFEVDGSQIPIGVSGTPTTPSAWYYDNDEANYGIDGAYKCGLLYNWYAAKYLDDNKSTLLPDGWHVPTNDEWNTLATAVGGSDTAGKKLKALDNSVISEWPSSWNGTDDYGFNAVPAGIYNPTEETMFRSLGSYTTFWTSTEYDSGIPYTRWLYPGTPLNWGNTDAAYGHSIRLIKDK